MDDRDLRLTRIVDVPLELVANHVGSSLLPTLGRRDPSLAFPIGIVVVVVIRKKKSHPVEAVPVERRAAAGFAASASVLWRSVRTPVLLDCVVIAIL